MALNDMQLKVIRENPHMQASKLAGLLNCSRQSISLHRSFKWFYGGVGIPFMHFDSSRPQYEVNYKGHRVARGTFSKCLSIVEHLIWCIENNMFNQPRIEHPYFENLPLIKEQ